MKPIGLVFIGLKIKKKIIIKKFLFKNKNRNTIQKNTVKEAFKMILGSLK